MLALFSASTLFTFGVAAAAIVAAPGPGQALVLTRTLEGGIRPGLWTAFGLEIGTIVHTFAAAVGLSAILATSAMAFAIVKYLGAAYLLWLGIRAFRSAHEDTREAEDRQEQRRTSHLVAHAAVTGILNPKVAIFFLAFLPQFVDPARGRVVWQFVLLGFAFATLGFLGDSLVAGVAGRARRRLVTGTRSALWRERATGSVLIALGIRLAFQERH